MSYIEAFEDALSKKPQVEKLLLKPSDVPDTYAEVRDVCQQFGYKTPITISFRVKNFVDWLGKYFSIKYWSC